MPVENTFGNQGPYQYYDNTDPNSLYNADGTRKNPTGSLVKSGIESGIKAVPVVGQIYSGITSITKPIQATNTAGGDATGAALDPFGQQFNYFSNYKQETKGEGQAQKVGEGIGEILGGPIFDAIKAVSDGNKRRNAEKQFHDQQNYYKDAYSAYALNNNGISYGSTGRPVNSVNQPNQHAGVQAGMAGIGAFGGDILKQLLANHTATPQTGATIPTQSFTPVSGNTGVGGGGVQFQNPNGGDSTGAPFNTNMMLNQGANTPDLGSVQSSNPILDGMNSFGSGSGGVSDTASMDTLSAPAIDSGGGGLSFDAAGYTAYAEGGVAHVKGGKGDDDIALVHADTGKDTGVRVEKGEMIVFSKDNVDALRKAIESGDKDGAFKMMSEQIKKKGEHKDGSTGYSEGGTVTSMENINYKDALAEYNRIKDKWDKKGEVSYDDKDKFDKLKQIVNSGAPEDRISTLSNEELAALKSSATSINARGHGKVLDAANAELEKRGLTHGYENVFGKPDQSGTRASIVPDKKFNYFDWYYNKSGKKDAATNDATQKHIDEAQAVAKAKEPPRLGVEYNNNMTKPAIHKDSPEGDILSKSTFANGANTHKPDANGYMQRHTPDGTPVAEMPIQKNPLDQNNESASSNQASPVAPLTSNTTGPHDQENNHGFDWGSAGEYGASAAKGVLGMVGANETLPTYQISPDWTQYSDRVRQQSYEGLPEADKAMAKNDSDNTLLTMLERNRNIGGGNAGLIMAGDQAAIGQHNRAAVQLASVDAAAKRANLSAYAPVANENLALDRQSYEDQYNRINATKQSGAQLAAMAENDVNSHAMFDRFYGRNSDYQKLKDVELQRAQTAADSEKSGNEVALKGGFRNSYTSNKSADPSYNDYKKYQDWLMTQKTGS
jgi:hypothetical protein